MHGTARCLPLLALTGVVALLAAPGCARHHYRERTDKDVVGVISQKNIFPDWQVKNWHVYPDPRARFADKTNPDRPPYPPDDYAARLLSPNPQRPTKKSGVGRVEGTGYLALLEQWDAENRASDPTPNVRGNVSAQTPVQTPAAKGTAQAARTAPAKPPSKWTGRPVIPAPTLLEGEPPAVRHALPPEPSGPVRTAGGPLGVPQPLPPAGSKPGEFGPWIGVRSSQAIPGPVVADRGNGPSITELRAPVVVVVAGEIEQDGKPVPAIAIVPAGGQPPAQEPPTILPIPQPVLPPPGVIPQPGPMPPEPKKPGDPMGMADPGGSAGDPAAEYLKALESGETGYRIKLEQAVELGLLNGREFQDRREDLFLAALPVTLARFNFAALGFSTQQAVRRSTGRELANGGERWTLNGSGGVTKLFPTGAQLLVQLANQVVVDLSGNSPTTTVGNLTLSLAQPFLRGGGKAVTLESLTLAERNLLYAMRSYARFRKVFFVAIAAGGGYTNNPYGLQGLSPNLGRGIGGNLTAPNAGYLPLLLQDAVINNQRRNVVALQRLLRLYEAFREGGQQSPLQVSQVEVQLLSSRGQLLGSSGGGSSGIRGYLDSLDNFKLQLGLPVTVPLELDDGPLGPIRQQLARFDELFAQAAAMARDAAVHDRTAVAAFRKRWLALLTDSPLVKGTTFAKEITVRWGTWAPDKLTEAQVLARMAKLREERRKLLDERVDRELKKVPEPPAEVARLARLEADLDLGEFELQVRKYEAQPWAKEDPRDRDSVQNNVFSKAFNAFYQVVLEAQQERLAQLYRSWPALQPLPLEGGIDALTTSLDEAYTAAVQTALTNRLDLMNARAQVVDAWRQIAVQANSLQGAFDVRYDLGSSTPSGGNNPVAFSGDRSTHQLTFRVDLPLVRRAERNNYRAALVAYQRQRRTLMAFEDNIANDVRSDLRELRTLGQLYRIQQRVVELNYKQVDNATAVLFAPPAPGAGSDAGSAAALTQQVLQSQNGLVGSQNSLYQLWVNYLIARMNFYLDLEQMPLDDRGVWCDELFNRTNDPARPDQRPGERLHAPQPLNGPGR